MYIKTALAFFKFIYRPRETLQRLGAFLCREKISALEENLSVAEARLVDVQRKADELHRECVKQSQDLAVLRADADRRAAYRHVLVDGANGVFALRKGFGEVPRLVCPVCFERGAITDLCVGSYTANRYAESAKKLTKLRCADAGCGLIKYGSALVPFINRFPKDTQLYKLMTTKPGEGQFANPD